MYIPGSWEEIRLVGILRALQKTHDETSEILKMQKLRVGNIEKWLREALFDQVEALFTIYSIQKVIDDALVNKEIDPQDLARAARLTPEDILEHFRQDYYLHKKLIKTYNEAESTLHQEHHQSMLTLIERLIIDLKADLSSPYIRKLKDSKKGNRDIEVDYVLKPNENTEVQIVRQYLNRHFNSSRYGWVMNDKERGMIKWTRIVNDELNRRIKLLRSIDREATRKTGFPINNPNSTGYIGPSYWFCESIFDSVLENLYLDLDYRVESAENRLFGLRYGPAFIAQTERKEKVLEYKDYHKQLMARYEKSKMVKAIKRIKKERNSTAEEIDEILQKFLVDKYVPGKCNYEFCG